MVCALHAGLPCLPTLMQTFRSLLRDVPFSAIYFTAYAHLKKDMFREGENGKTLTFMQTLTAAGIAGT